MKIKKQALVCLCLILVLTVGGCGKTTGNSQAPVQASSSESSAQPEEPVADSEGPTEESSPLEGGVPGMVADAAMYRGVVTAVEEQDGRILLTLEQAEGTNFGSGFLTVVVNESTNMSDEPAEGNYVQVFYGAALGEENEQQVEALSLSVLPDAQLCLVNGQIVEIIPDGELDGQGSLLLIDQRTETEIVFHYNEETQFYLNFEEMEEGDILNVFFSGATTRSNPPQATALEVRPYQLSDDVRESLSGAGPQTNTDPA